MANNVRNVFAAMPRATGALFRGPAGTTLPTSARTDITSFTDLIDQGFIGEDGFTQSESRDTDKKKAFGGTVVKVLQTDYSLTIQFAFLESLNAEVLKSIYGEENVVIGTEEDPDEIVVYKNKRQSPHSAWVIDVFDGDALNRTTIADGQITEVDDIVKVHTDTIMYTVTMECFEDANGNNLVEHFATAAPNQVQITSGALAPATEDSAYGPVTLTATGGTGALTWSIIQGDLPAGVTLNASTGVINGTPTEPGTFDIVVRVEDESDPAKVGTKAYTLVVANT